MRERKRLFEFAWAGWELSQIAFFPFSAESLNYVTPGRSPDSDAGTGYPTASTFPGFQPSGVPQSGVRSLQWRDRAGFTPDFPVRPLRAPEELQANMRGRNRSMFMARLRTGRARLAMTP